MALIADVDQRDVDRAFDALARAGRDIGHVLRELMKPLRADLREHQRERRGPDGPWPGPASETVRKRGRSKSGRRKRKRSLGKLASQVAMRVEDETLVAENRVPWARVHQEGGTVGHGAEIPARPFMYTSNEFDEDVVEAVDAHLTRAWERG